MRASSRICSAVSVAACVLACSAQVFAASSDAIELSWNAPDACSSAADVLELVDAQLGEEFVSQTRIRARGDLRKQENHEYELQLQYTTDAGAQDQRRIRGETCAAVTSGAALILALALDRTRVLAEEPGAPPPSAAEPPGEGGQFSLGMRALFDTAVMSLPTVGGGLGFAFRYGPLELSASVQLFLPRAHTTDGISLRLNYWSLDVGACYVAPVAGWSIGPCAHFELGRLSGTPEAGIESPTPESEWVHAATLAAKARLPIFGAFQLELVAGLEWVARRPQFVLMDGTPIASPALFGARVLAGPSLAF